MFLWRRIIPGQGLNNASIWTDSGLCKASPEVRIAFATDPLNLTLAAPNVNRCGAGGKCGYDGGEWLPERNKCWFSHSVVAVRKKYGLTIDRAEATSLEEVMSNCSSFEMVFEDIHTEQMDFAASGASNPLERYDTNNNGKNGNGGNRTSSCPP